MHLLVYCIINGLMNIMYPVEDYLMIGGNLTKRHASNISRYKFGLSVCLFVSNKRQNG